MPIDVRLASLTAPCRRGPGVCHPRPPILSSTSPIRSSPGGIGTCFFVAVSIDAIHDFIHQHDEGCEITGTVSVVALLDGNGRIRWWPQRDSAVRRVSGPALRGISDDALNGIRP